jgi:PAS domain S-box-containing protein
MEDGEIKGAVVTFRDITERKEAEEALKESEQRLELALQGTNLGIWDRDIRTGKVICNERTAEIYGYSSVEELDSTSDFWDLSIHPDDKSRVIEYRNKHLEGVTPFYEAEYRLRTGSGELKWISSRGKVVARDEDGNPLRITGTLLDITDRKMAEESLKESEEWLKVMFEYAPDAYYFNDLQGIFIDGNKIAEEITGYKKEELIGHSYLNLNLLSPDQIPKALENLEKSAKGLSTGPDEFILRQKNGTLIPVEIQTSPVHFKGKTLVMGIARDITVRKRAEEALRESERRFRTLVENSPMGIWQDDIEQKTVYINQAMLTMLEIERPEDTYGHNWKSFFTTEGLETIARETKKRSGGISSSYELELTGRHGTKRSAIVYGAPLVSSDGIMKGTIATFLDITERKQAEERLTLLKEAIEALPIGITISSTDQKILYVNPAEAKLHGYEVDELTGKDARIFAPQESWRPMTFEEIHEMGIWKRESSNVRKNGETFPVELTSIAVKDISGVPIGIIIACEDITERKRSENELIRAEKLESLSVLASGIAHDFNNMLTIILTSIALAKHYAQDNVKASFKLQETEKEIFLAKELTNQLLTFSKGGTPVKKLASVSELLEDVTRFSLKGSDLLCEFHFADDLWAAEIDSGQISQVVSNIAINSKQAMPSGGILKVSAENIAIDKEKNLPLPDGTYVKISIQDEGTGISEKNIKKIFDPFFTTKEGGTGLGLSSSYSIIKNHQGYIDVASDVGVGTTFDIYLPASEDQEITHDAIVEKWVKMHWRLLLMEDEAKIRENVTELLTTVGYDVETAREGNEAIQLYKTALHSHQPFHAVLMDLTISGGMGAIECIRELTSIDPDIKAFLMSGYTSSPEMVQFKEYGFKGVIYKPFNIEDVDRTLQAILLNKGE